MSRPRYARTLALLVLLLLCGSVGCWEQWSNEWWPQMKWQPAVQAYEIVPERVAAFLPPEGTVPVTGLEAPVDNVVDAASDGIENPNPISMASLENGRLQYERFCAACHGVSGMGDGPVSMMGEMRGPIAGVLPLAVAAARSDGHVYTTIRHGRRQMPGYPRIASSDRWDIVNYIRYLTGQTQGIVIGQNQGGQQ